MEECESCSFVTETRIVKNQGMKICDEVRLCGLCAETFSANAMFYPELYNSATLKTICYVGNKILEEIKKINITHQGA